MTMEAGTARSAPSRAATPHTKFLSGALCLDFANTLSGRMDEAPVERIETHADLIAWAETGRVLAEGRAEILRAGGAGRRAEGSTILARAFALRAAIHCAFAAMARGRPPVQGAIDRLNPFVLEAARHRRLEPAGGGAAWRWHGPAETLDQVLWPIALSAADLLTASSPFRIKECPGPHCGWLFLDRSKNGSRRWCEMAVCGNRAKARRFKRRQNREQQEVGNG